MTTWRDLFPEGRVIFYEGNNPKAFAKQIKERFGFDPSSEPETWSYGHGFWCPAEHLDAIFGSGDYPVCSFVE